MRQLILELPDQIQTNLVMVALDGYKARLRLSIAATEQVLSAFEQRYGVTTEHFLRGMAAEDLEGGDMEYVEWAGESKLLDRLEQELQALEGIRCDVP